MKANPTECTDVESATRRELAALYRLAVHYGWTDVTSTHISARLQDDPDHYLLNSHDLMFEEITASNLTKMSFAGEARRVVREVDPSLPLNSVNTVEEVVSGSTAQEGFFAFLLGAFALLGEGQEFSLDQIDNATKRLGQMRWAGADRYLNRQRVRIESISDFLEHGVKVGTLAVHLVDERNPRNVVFVCLPPYCF